MIMIQTKNYNSTDVNELFDALFSVREKVTREKNSCQVIADLDYALTFLMEQYRDKLKSEQSRS